MLSLGKLPVLRDVAIYAAGNGAAALLPLITLPILTRYLSPGAYGLYSNVLALAAFLVPLAGLGLANVVARDYAYRQTLDFSAVVTTCTLMAWVATVVLSIGVAIAALLVPGVFASVLGSSSLMVIAAGMAIVASQALLPIALSVFQMQRRVVLYGVVRILQAAAFAVGSIVVVLLLTPSGERVVYARAAVDMAILVGCLLVLRREGMLGVKIDGSESARCLRYSLPLVPHMAAVAAIGAADRLIVTYVLGLDAAGTYSVGQQVGMIMWLAVNSTNQAWQPWFYEQMAANTPDARQRIVRASYLVIAGWILIAALFWMVAPLIVQMLVSESFGNVTAVTRWIVVGFVFQGLYSLANSYLYFSGKTALLAWATTATAGVHIVLTLGLTRMNGIEGAAQAVVGSYLVSFAVVALIAYRVQPMPWFAAIGNGVVSSEAWRQRSSSRKSDELL